MTAVGAGPVGIAKARCGAGPNAGSRQDAEPGVERRRDINNRRHSRKQQLAHRHADVGGKAFGSIVEDRQKLIQRGMEKAEAANFVGDAFA